MQKGFTNIALIIILVLIAGGVGYYFAKQGTKEESSQVKQEEPKEVPTGPFIGSENYVPPPPLCTSSTAPWIKVLSPNGGETFQANGQVPVIWQSCNLPTPWVVVSLREQNGSDFLLTDPETIDDGNETFIPSSNISSGNYKIRVGHAAATIQQDLSDNFFSIQ